MKIENYCKLTGLAIIVMVLCIFVRNSSDKQSRMSSTLREEYGQEAEKHTELKNDNSKVNHQSVEATQTLGQKQTEIEKNTVGIWADDFFVGVYVRIRYDSGRCLFERIASVNDGPKKNAEIMRKIIRRGKTHFMPAWEYDNNEELYDYYVLDATGDLSVYDNLGYITTYKKVK